MNKTLDGSSAAPELEGPPAVRVGKELCAMENEQVNVSTENLSNTILIVDDVIPAVRSALRSRFSRAKNTAQTREAIRSQVIVELERKLAQEIIDGYGDVTAQVDTADPTVCVVEFSFSVSHGLNQIYLTAHITV